MYMLRREKFGSVLFDNETFRTYLCNHTATEMLQFIEDDDGIHINDIERISSHIQKTFKDVPSDIDSIVCQFIDGCLQLNETPLAKRD